MTTESAPWVEGLTIGETLRRTAARYPDRDAYVFPRLDPHERPFNAKTTVERRGCLRVSYREFDAQVDRVAKALLGLGIKKGDHVAVWATNWPKWILLQFATARVGAVMVLVNPAYRTAELSYVLKQSDAVALFLIDAFRGSDYFAMANQVVPELAGSKPGELNAHEFPRLRHVVSMSPTQAAGMWAWNAFSRLGESVSDSDFKARASQLSPRDALNVQYTSGTTGFPKGAMLTHRNLLLNAYYVGVCQRFTADDRICIPVPFYHCFGCVLGTLCCTVYGAAMIVPAEHFDPEATLNAIESERATTLYGVPTMFIAQLEHPTFAGRDLKSLRTGVMAGSPCPVELMTPRRRSDGHSRDHDRVRPDRNVARHHADRTDDPLELRVQTVGRPLPGLEVKLVDPASRPDLGRQRARRTLHAGTRRDARLLQDARGDCGRHRSRGMAAHRRSGAAAAQRLLPHHRPDQGNDLPRRRKHLSPRDRGVSVHASGSRERGRLRRARSQVRGGRRRLGQAPRRARR